MFAGESAKVKFRADNRILDQVIDWFGMELLREKLFSPLKLCGKRIGTGTVEMG